MYAPEWSAKNSPSALMRLTVWSLSFNGAAAIMDIDDDRDRLTGAGRLSHCSILAVYQPLRPELSSETKSVRIFVNLSIRKRFSRCWIVEAGRIPALLWPEGRIPEIQAQRNATL